MVVFGRKWEVLSKVCLKKCELFLTRDILPATSENLPETRAVSILTLFLASLSSLFLPRHQHLPDVAGQPGLIPTDTLSSLSSSFVLGTDRPTFLSSFVVTFKKRCLYSFIGICGTWMHRFAFWKFYSKPGLITSFRSALRSVRMDAWKHWSLSALITFSMLAEALRSCDLSRKIEGDSVRRLIDQILGSYLLSCMAFSDYEVVRVTCLSPSWFIYISPWA